MENFYHNRDKLVDIFDRSGNKLWTIKEKLKKIDKDLNDKSIPKRQKQNLIKEFENLEKKISDIQTRLKKEIEINMSKDIFQKIKQNSYVKRSENWYLMALKEVEKKKNDVNDTICIANDNFEIQV